MKKFEIEANEILKEVDCFFPKEFEGQESILWLHKYSNNKKQDEWAGFFFEDFCFLILSKFLGGWKGPRITKSARFDYQRHFVWDFKMHSNKNKWAPLNDKAKTDQVVEENSGIGYIIAKADFSYDQSGMLKQWRNGMEGRTTQGHKLKSSGKITKIFAVFLTKSDIKLGINDGWIKDYKQGRNSGASAAERKVKYQINVEKIPQKFIIKIN